MIVLNVGNIRNCRVVSNGNCNCNCNWKESIPILQFELVFKNSNHFCDSKLLVLLSVKHFFTKSEVLFCSSYFLVDILSLKVCFNLNILLFTFSLVLLSEIAFLSFFLKIIIFSRIFQTLSLLIVVELLNRTLEVELHTVGNFHFTKFTSIVLRLALKPLDDDNGSP